MNDAHHNSSDRIHGHKIPAGESLRWLDRPENVNKICYVLYALCALTVIGELFIHKHGYFNFENWFAFHGWFGFVSCCALVFAAIALRKVVMRDEDYYGD